MSQKIKLSSESILKVPLENYQKDFTFIVNGVKYETTKIITDLLSRKISHLHQNDPTINEIYITTKNRGNFRRILDLANFNDIEIEDNEISFISEIIEQLEIENISGINNDTNIEYNTDNIFTYFNKHIKSAYFYKNKIEQEIEYISSHFTEIYSKNKEQLLKMNNEYIEQIIRHEKLKLESEDELLQFLNEINSNENKENKENMNLYEFVLFKNVSKEKIQQFLSIFDIEQLTNGIWLSLSKRLSSDIVEEDDENKDGYENSIENVRYFHKKEPKFKEILYSNNQNNLKGIFNYFRTQSNINEEVKLTYSSLEGGDIDKLFDIENTTNDFYTNDEPNSWICFEFLKHKIIPTNYTIRSYPSASGSHHPKSWIIESSNDGNTWKKIDEQNNCSFLNGKNITHTFTIQETKQKIKFMRIRLIGSNWNNSNRLDICSIEIYGRIF